MARRVLRLTGMIGDGAMQGEATPAAMDIRLALQHAQTRIAPFDAQVLLRYVLGRDRAYLLAHPEQMLERSQQQRYAALVARREQGEPVAYLVGEREFWGLTFKVTPDVLIPRPETELLVELALERIARDAPARVLDLGAGSGALAVAIASERPRAEITAVDVSAAALAVAKDNAARLGARVRLLHSDWFAALAGERFDLIVGNPPYVAAADPHLAQGDVRHEPRGALIAGPDGLDAVRIILAGAAAHLAPGAWLLLEHGYDQEQACRALFAAHGYAKVQNWKDLAGQARVTGGVR